jgi:hypothetical protein
MAALKCTAELPGVQTRHTPSRLTVLLHDDARHHVLEGFIEGREPLDAVF